MRQSDKKKVIIVRLMGGLGNQLFQFSFGSKLSLNSTKRLLLDVSAYSSDCKRLPQLCDYEFAGKQICLTNNQRLNIQYYLARKLNLKCKNIIIEQEPYSCLQISDSFLYYVGYWQNVNYLYDMGSFRKKLVYKGRYSDKQKELNYFIETVNSVAIHIRRTDYLSPENKYYNVLSSQYYECCMSIINERLEDAYFFVFSDDMEFAKKMFQKYENIIFVDDSYENADVQDFEMMRKCKHFIIANSTFSWWASQLADYSAKIMLAPKTWFLCETNDACLDALMRGYYLVDV